MITELKRFQNYYKAYYIIKKKKITVLFIKKIIFLSVF